MGAADAAAAGWWVLEMPLWPLTHAPTQCRRGSLEAPGAHKAQYLVSIDIQDMTTRVSCAGFLCFAVFLL